MTSSSDESGKGCALVAGVAVFHEGKVLALRRAPWKRGAGLWEVVAGRVEEGETLESAALREVAEECGLEVHLDPRPLATYPIHGRKGAAQGDAPREYSVVLFRAFATTRDVVRSREHDAHRWVTPSEFRELSTLTALVEAIDANSK